MLKRLIYSLAFILGLVASFSALAEKGQDHPLVPRLPGYEIASYSQHDFDAYDRDLNNDNKPVLHFHAEGKVTQIWYDNAPHSASPLAIVRNYQNALKAIGATEVNNSSNPGVEHVMKLVRDNREVYVAVLPRGTAYGLTIIESQPMQQIIAANVKTISANDMHNALAKDGYIALYINFDTNKSDVKTEAEPVIKEIVKLLKVDPALKLSIEGHTDNAGSADSNRALSMNRAKSVMQAVVKQGIAVSRLSAQGFGQERPIADNRTEDGRAKNRRVELVK